MVRYKNVRVEVVKREGEKDWDGTGHYLSIRAYTGKGDQIMMGPDIPISSKLPLPEVERLAYVFLTAICGEDAAAQHAAAA